MVSTHHRIDQRVLWGAFALACIAWLWRPVRYANDVWWHLATGRYIVQHGTLPLTDVFSFTVAGHPWINQSWLLQVIWYGFYRIAGAEGLILFKVLLIGIALAFQWYRLHRWKISWPVSWATLFLVFWASRFGWNERADLASVCLLSALSFLLDTDLDRWTYRKYVYAGFLFALWSNMHGAFVLGGILVCIVIAGRFLEERAHPKFHWPIAVVCGVATLLNPYGWKLHESTIRALSLLKSGLFTEWQHTPWAPLQAFWGGLTIFWLVLAVVTWQRKRLPVSEAFVGIFLTWSAVNHVRNVPYAMFYCLPYAACHLDRMSWPAALHPWSTLLKRARLVPLAATLAFGIFSAASIQGGISRQHFPIDACEFIARTHLPARFYQVDGFGGYWIWRLGGTYPVFLDGRFHTVEGYTQLYDESRRAQASWPRDWQHFLDRYNIDAVLLSYPDVSPLPSTFHAYFPRAQWALVYWDDLSVIYVKRTPTMEKFIRRWEYSGILPDATPNYIAQLSQSSTSTRDTFLKDVRRNRLLHPDSLHTEAFWQALHQSHDTTR